MLILLPADFPSLQTMMSSLVSNIPELNALITATAYLAGFAFCLKGVYKLKEYGEMRSMMASQTSLFKPMILFLVGGLLMFFPRVYHIGLETFFGQRDPSPLAYQSTDYTSWYGIEGVIVQIVQLIGAIAFVRGVWMISGFSGQQSPQGAFGKAMTHIIGGILAINVVGFADVLKGTIGITVS